MSGGQTSTQSSVESLLEIGMDAPMIECGVGSEEATNQTHPIKAEAPIVSQEDSTRAASAKARKLLRFSIENILLPAFGSKGLRQWSGKHHHVQRCEPLNFANKFPAPIPTTSSAMNREIDAKMCPQLPAWIFCTRYSDRPSSGSRTRKQRKKDTSRGQSQDEEEKRPRTAFTTEQLKRLREQFVNSRYLTEKRRQELAHELGLNESQVKIWFQNKRAKLKKSSTQRHNYASQALQLMSQAFYPGIDSCRPSLKESVDLYPHPL